MMGTGSRAGGVGILLGEPGTAGHYLHDGSAPLGPPAANRFEGRSRSRSRRAETVNECPACDLCGGSNARLLPWVITGRRIRVAVCWSCGLLYRVPRFDEREGVRLYRDVLADEIGKITPALAGRQELVEGRLAEARARARREVIPLVARNLVPTGRRVLEVRPGTGAVLAEWQALGASVEGLEIFPRAAEWASRRHGCSVHLAPSVHDLWSPVDARFDAVSMLSVDVVCHAPSPTALLRGAWERLVPGGLLFLCEPDPRNVEPAPHPFALSPTATRGHLHFPTPGALRALITKTGFELVEAVAVRREPGGRLWAAVVARRPVTPTPSAARNMADDPKRLVAEIRRAWARHLLLGNPLRRARHLRRLAAAGLR